MVCKEGVLWFDQLRGDRHDKPEQERWASVYTNDGWLQLESDREPPPLDSLDAIRYLHEPDPAVIRAGALGRLCTLLDAHLFDPQIAYLVSPIFRPHPLVQSFEISEIAPFSLKQLNRRLQDRGIGQIELKKRGFPVAPEELRPRLKLVKRGGAGVVIFTRRADERFMFIGKRIASPISRQ